MRADLSCRFCGAELDTTFVDLGQSPLANNYLSESALNRMEPFLPLHVYVCRTCWLVQLEALETPAEIFSDYAYFSSFSDSWVAHARAYCDQVTRRFSLSARSQVLEIASNDGYLLQHFVAAGIPALGIEPAANVAAAAVARGIPTRVAFFSKAVADDLVASGLRANLVLGNNVFAHVPNLNDFVAGLRRVLAPGGVLTLEFPHLLRLMAEHQFDTIYHEHFSYFSLSTARRVLAAHDLDVFDVEELSTHGGSIRIFARATTGPHDAEASDRVTAVLAKERAAGLEELETYKKFDAGVQETKRRLLSLLIDLKRRGKSIAGYGAPAKGNTLLNYCGIRRDFVDYTVDRSPHKQDRYLPGTHIPIRDPEYLRKTRPDYVLILPWNLKDEIMAQMQHVRDWGGQFIVPIPYPEIVS